MTGISVSMNNLQVRLGKRMVLSSISFDATAGRMLVVIGPNGAGKSTLLKSIVGVVNDGGAVAFRGTLDAVHSRSRVVAYVPQLPTLPQQMTVAEYVLLGRTAHLEWFGAEGAADRHKVLNALERLDLQGFAGRFLNELSGGEVQRVCIARALAQESPVLVLDEPTSALDLAHQVAVGELVTRLKVEGNLTIIMAMHDLTLASRYADDVALLADGKLQAYGSPVDVLTEPLLSKHYGTPIRVFESPDGDRVVVPHR